MQSGMRVCKSQRPLMKYQQGSFSHAGLHAHDYAHEEGENGHDDDRGHANVRDDG